jgi:hypothetical protein
MKRPNKKRVAKLLREAAELCAEIGEHFIYYGACCFIEHIYWESEAYARADLLGARSAFSYIEPTTSHGLFWFGSPRKENVGVRVLALCMAAAIVETEGV